MRQREPDELPLRDDPVGELVGAIEAMVRGERSMDGLMAEAIGLKSGLEDLRLTLVQAGVPDSSLESPSGMGETPRFRAKPSGGPTGRTFSLLSQLAQYRSGLRDLHLRAERPLGCRRDSGACQLADRSETAAC